VSHENLFALNYSQLFLGGIEAKAGEFPHQALLGYNNGDANEWGCGGSLISSRFVITAAHCLYPRALGAVKFVKLGVNSRSQNDDRTLVYVVSEIFEHPNYNKKTFNEDLGLLKLNASVQFSEFVMPICLPSKSPDANKAVASGFGRTGYQQASSEDLLKVVLEKFTTEECQEAFGSAVTVCIMQL
jgi:V8-like Glu-specific endopeptidase